MSCNSLKFFLVDIAGFCRNCLSK
ncbi:MAG: DUF1244 domain-containing protein [Candidatus Methanoperedens sp.]|nr:DUF1244 domain-containing protein [Candidatus Methanoperedens sp.]MCE8425390.1 DUF1244 domain-containing protein [Candidatus Methanoperedens sp.]MCE8428345.1 DUF1244 domain-containing protein [Candidatus Methanoperedens sp.]